jgi:hypothetical protein
MNAKLWWLGALVIWGLVVLFLLSHQFRGV